MHGAGVIVNSGRKPDKILDKQKTVNNNVSLHIQNTLWGLAAHCPLSVKDWI